MTPKTNNNDGKNLSKTIAMAGMGFLLIAAAFTFSFANSGQQLVNAQEGGNATTTIVATPFDTFTGDGVITATIQEEGGGGGGNETAAAAGGGNETAAAAGGGNETAAAGGGEEGPYILGGNWNLDVESGNVTDFTANFIMVHTDGTGYHVHNITDFSAGNATVQLVEGLETTISGNADIYTNGTNSWPGTETTLTLTQNGAVMTIMPAAEDTENHFQGQPIYGIISSLAGENGTLIAQTTPPQAAQEGEEGGEEGGGGPLDVITDPLQDLFGGGN
ncbi:MAG: hypothetical protein QOK66_02385 [Nitrososphaeraceae archaeon]|nr:hypothetical protein [Nitrososphaeraceae archaeon]